MDDLISRQAAIDGKIWIQLADGVEIYSDEAVPVEYLKRLPSAQPEPCKDVQHILDYIDEVLHPIVSPEHWNVYCELHDMIASLPSAQPIIHCGTCKYHHYENGIPYCYRIDYGYGWKERDFCSRAERREE